MVHREDVTHLRIRIPVTVEEPISVSPKSLLSFPTEKTEEEANFWDDGWRTCDEWQAYYDYQDYLAELREAQHQLMSDWWDW